jgi:tetratricopeptide (TPR) repeat protein
MIPMIAVLVLSPELLGGVFPWTIAAICVMAAATGFFASRRIEIISHDRRSAGLLDWMMVAALVWTGFQLLPMPTGLVARLVPEAVAASRSNALLYGESVRSWLPLSLDLGATRLEVAKGSAIVTVFVAARIFAASHQRRRVLEGVGASAVVLALVALGHKLADTTSVFGLYEPVYASSRLLAPLMNENHLGGFMAMACPILAGLAMDAETLERRIAWALGATVCSATGVLSFSRGAIGALIMGLALFMALYIARVGPSPRSILRSRTAPILTAGVLLMTLFAVALEGTNLAREFSHTHNLTTKFEAAAAAFPVIASHPIAGVGRGAFSAAFVSEHGTEKRFFHPENLLVQWTSEWGLPFALALLAVVIWSIVRGFRRRRSHAQLGGLAGLVAIGGQQMVDFSLELTGVAVVAAATLGAVADSAPVRFEVSLRKLGVALSVLSLAGAGLALSLHQRDVFSLERRARDALRAADHAEARRLVEAGLALHPSEPIFALTGAEVAVRERDPSAARWINRAQDLAPLWSAPHLLAARWLFSIDRVDQALIEIREAEARQPGSARATLCQLLKTKQDPAIALRAAPPGPEGAKLLDRAAQCLPLSSAVAAAIDDHARQIDANLAGPATRQARRLLAANRPLEAIDVLAKLRQRDPSATRIFAEAHMQAGNPEAAAAAIGSLLHRQKISSDILRTAASVYVALGDDRQARLVASRLRAQAEGKTEALSDVDFFLGGLYESHQRYAPALKAYEDSNRTLESQRALVAIARVAEALGNRERALLAYKRLCRSDGGKGKACASAEELAKPVEALP